jgi:hypothetical protein
MNLLSKKDTAKDIAIIAMQRQDNDVLGKLGYSIDPDKVLSKIQKGLRKIK